MAKAQVTLPNGTTVSIDGTMDEIKNILDYYGGRPTSTPSPRTSLLRQPGTMTMRHATESPNRIQEKKSETPLAEIVNLVKNCDEAEKIEKQILDCTGQVNRTLLPLYIVHEHFRGSPALTTGEISKITSDLGIPVQTANVSHVLTGSGSRYVMGDRVRQRGQPVRYKLSRRGLKYMQAVIEGKEDGK